MNRSRIAGSAMTMFFTVFVMVLLLGAPSLVFGDGGQVGSSRDPVPTAQSQFIGEVDLASQVMEQYLVGQEKDNGAGYALISADLNGDRMDDLVVSAPGFNGTRGQVFIFFGGNIERVIDLRDADVKIEGQEENEFFGLNLETGDVNGDGYNDLLVSGYLDQYTYPTAPKRVHPIVSLFLGEAKWSYRILSPYADTSFIGPSKTAAFGWDIEIGNINNDDYDDIIISDVYHGPSSSSGSVYIYEGRFLFQPVYNASLGQYDHRIFTSEDDYDGGYGYWGLASSDLDVADINDDDYMDILIGSDMVNSNGIGSGEVEVVFGASNLPMDIDLEYYTYARIVSYADYGLGQVSHADWNGDGVQDLIVSAPYGFFDHKGGIFIFHGDVLFPAGDTYLIDYDFLVRGPSAYWGFGVLGIHDVDTDGRDDLVIYSDMGKANDNIGCYYILHSTETASLSDNIFYMQFEDPDFLMDAAEKNSGFGYYQLDNFAIMDFNGDDIDEILVGAPMGNFEGYPVNVGVVFFYYQVRSVLAIDRFELIDGDGPGGSVLGAGKPYHISGYASNTWGIQDFRQFDVNFIFHGPSVEGRMVVLAWDRGLMKMTEKSDLYGYMEVLSSSVEVNGSTGMSIEIEFMFNAVITSEEMVDMSVAVLGGRDLSASLAKPSLFKVEADVDYFGTLQVISEFNGLLTKGSYVKANEKIEITGLKPVYQGTTVSPPNSYYKIKMTDSVGNVFVNSSTSGRDIYFTFRTREVAGREDFNLSFIDLYAEADNEAGVVSFFYLVDTDMPEPPNEVIARADSDIDTLTGYDNDPEVFLTWLPAFDTTSEVIGYMYSTEDGGGTGMGTFTSRTTIRYTLTQAGWNTVYLWSVDSAHNYGPSTMVNIYYDMEAPIFGVPSPAPESWVDTNSVNYEITLRDQDGSGVRGTSIEYSTSYDGGQSFTAWEPTGIRREGEQVTVKLLINFREGKDNLIRWRAKDIAGNGYVVSDTFRVKVDTVPLSYKLPTPEEPVTDSYVVCGITLNDVGSGVDASTIEYTVSHNGVSNYGPWETLDISGAYETITAKTPAIYFEKNSVNYIKWRAKDIAGNGYVYSFDIPVEILPEKVNNRPVPIVTSPDPKKTYTDTEAVRFDGSTSRDPDDDGLKYLWYSDIQGYLGTDAVIEKVLQVGYHTVTLHVFDGVDNESIALNIQVRPDIRSLDTDRDGIPDFQDDDDDNDGLLDIQEDANKNGIIDGNETDPKNPNTDGDPVNDKKDIAPLDPTIWEIKDDSTLAWWLPLLIVLLIIMAIVVIGLLLVLKQRTDKETINARRSLRRTRRNLRRFEVLTGVPTNDLPAIEAVQWALPGVINEASGFVLEPPTSDDMLPPSPEDEVKGADEPEKPELKDMEVPAPAPMPEAPKQPEAPKADEKRKVDGKSKNCSLCGSEVAIPEGATSAECPLCGEMIKL
ncbi:MAG: hypothetical protein MUC62_01850 [Candidatus Thermoplasmatota archaeon]|jgi:hypothetical protein|nr:hypothetical protein [Candidatus Thermoplasmatota archaeon]